MGGRASSAKRKYTKQGFTKKSLASYYDRHVLKRKDTVASSPREYEEMAMKFRDRKKTKNSGIEEFVDKDGDLFRYNKDTNEFIIVKDSGQIITYYNPTDKLKYWETQILKYKPKGEK